MKLLKSVMPVVLIFYSAFASAINVTPKGFSLISTKEIKESDVRFNYQSNDGTIDLKCAHVFDKPDAWDFDVWCGKGTNMLRQFRVHFLVRQYQSAAANKSAYEVLYWVIDRDQKDKSRAFNSTSTWLQFNGLSTTDMLSFSQGIENDYAYLTVEFKP